MLSFIKDAGEKLLGVSDATPSAPTGDRAATNAAAAKAIENYIHKMNLDAASGEVVVRGKAATQEVKEKILLCCGNLKGVSPLFAECGKKEETTASGTAIEGVAQDAEKEAADAAEKAVSGR